LAHFLRLRLLGFLLFLSFFEVLFLLLEGLPLPPRGTRAWPSFLFFRGLRRLHRREREWLQGISYVARSETEGEEEEEYVVIRRSHERRFPFLRENESESRERWRRVCT
jgi:hypothetical protein